MIDSLTAIIRPSGFFNSNHKAECNVSAILRPSDDWFINNNHGSER